MTHMHPRGQRQTVCVNVPGLAVVEVGAHRQPSTLTLALALTLTLNVPGLAVVGVGAHRHEGVLAERDRERVEKPTNRGLFKTND